MKNILIIGGCGYIGSSLCLSLSPEHKIEVVDLGWFSGNHDPVYYKDGITYYTHDFGQMNGDFIRRFDVVIVAAAHSSVSLCQKDPYGAFRNNVVNFCNLLQKIQKHQKLIYMSSSCVYTGIPGSCHEETPPCPPCDHLTLTKQTIDRYAALSDVEYYGLRLGSVNGWSPNLRSDLMINAMTLSGLNTGEVHVTNGDYYRPILAMSDLCRAVSRIVESSEDRRGLYNIASFYRQIREIGSVVAGLTSSKLMEGEATGGYDFQMSTEKFCRVFQWLPEGDMPSIVDSIKAGLMAYPDNYMASRDASMEYKGV